MKMDNLTKQIFSLTWPAVIEMTLLTLVWTIDAAMVGRLSPAAITGVNLGANIMFGIGNTFGALRVGVTVLVARYIGAKDEEKAQRIGAQALMIGTFFSFLLASMGVIFAPVVFPYIVQDPEIIMLGTEYLKIVFVGLFFYIPFLIGNAILRGGGNAVIPLLCTTIAVLFNIVGDYVLIFGKLGFPELGVRGAAIATTGAYALGTIAVMCFLFKGKYNIRIQIKDLFLVNSKVIKNILSLSVPAGLETFINEGSKLLSFFWIAQLGAVAYAAHSLAWAAETISFMPGIGFAMATTVLVAQYLGENNFHDANETSKKSTIYASCLMGLVGIAFLSVPQPIMRIFTTDVEVLAMAAICLRVGAFEQIPIAISMTLSGALKGAGDTKGPFKISIISNFLIRLPFIYVIVFVLRLHVGYIWAASVVQYSVEGALMFLLYRKSQSKNGNIIPVETVDSA